MYLDLDTDDDDELDFEVDINVEDTNLFITNDFKKDIGLQFLNASSELQIFISDHIETLNELKINDENENIINEITIRHFDEMGKIII